MKKPSKFGPNRGPTGLSLPYSGADCALSRPYILATGAPLRRPALTAASVEAAFEETAVRARAAAQAGAGGGGGQTRSPVPPRAQRPPSK